MQVFPTEKQKMDNSEFMMYTFKVVSCKIRHSHDWSRCCYVHHGEDSRRRDPRKHHYSSVICPEFSNSWRCSKGESCPFSHGRYEWGLHPSHYRTRFCNNGTECTREVCFFAHKPEEIRRPENSSAYSLPTPLSNSGSAHPFRLRPPTIQMPMNFARNTDLHNEFRTNQNMRRLPGIQVDQRGYPPYSTNSDVIGLPQSRADPSMSSRYDATSKRSQEFIEHSSMPSFNPNLSSATSVSAEPSNLSGWGSGDRKLDWSIPGDELNRRTKLYSSGLGNKSSIPTMAAPNVDDPDVLLSEEPWVESLLKDDDPTSGSDH
ncbi:zinc finger CCCH domain-containing protein 33-like [Trifolium pratense]|nr:zinc finger CCCH domain-containing protein 33-like [Trifolium pratense]